MVINLFLSPVLALFMAYFVKYYDTIDVDHPTYTFYHNDDIPVYFFMSVVVALFVGLIVSAEEIFRDRKILKRERYLHLSRSSYLISKILVLFSLSAIQTLTFVLVGNWILQIPVTEIRYFLILFTCSCVANLMGLNISSAFDSAVTIYILIPILIIPQLLLSGVVISFDKFNPKVGAPKGIPLMGEVMASRWAFEAFMVTQFKDNPFEKQFYDLEQKLAIAKYKRDFYIPRLETKLSIVLNNRDQWRNPDNQEVAGALTLLRNEIGNELAGVGHGNLPEAEKLVIGKVDSAACKKTAEFLTVLKRFYNLRRSNAESELEKRIIQMTDTQEKMAAYNAMKLSYKNDAVTRWVERTDDPKRILEWDGELVQKVYPIYCEEHRPKHRLDFTANFFIPTKHFLGETFDTLYFNVAAIWVMGLILYATLYYEVLKKIVHAFETRRKYSWGRKVQQR